MIKVHFDDVSSLETGQHRIELTGEIFNHVVHMDEVERPITYNGKRIKEIGYAYDVIRTEKSDELWENKDRFLMTDIELSELLKTERFVTWHQLG